MLDAPQKSSFPWNLKKTWLLSEFGSSLQTGFSFQPTPLKINGWFTLIFSHVEIRKSI